MTTSAASQGIPATLLVIAKAPIAGFAKTRLTPDFSPREAAQIAAAALLDTLRAVRHSGVRHRMVAWTGDLTRAELSGELSTALGEFDLIPQRGTTFGQRLANAHADASRLACRYSRSVWTLRRRAPRCSRCRRRSCSNAGTPSWAPPPTAAGGHWA